MELKEVLLKRRSVRKFTLDEVSDNDINELMHAAMSGPTACNNRDWFFVVVKDKEKKELLKKATRYSSIDGNIAIIVCGDLTRALPGSNSLYWVEDCSAATENILLRATDLALGAVWCGVFPQEENCKKVSSILNLEDNYIPLNIIWVGHPKENPISKDWYEEDRVRIV